MRFKRLLVTAALCLTGMFLIVRGAQFLSDARSSGEIAPTSAVQAGSLSGEESASSAGPMEEDVSGRFDAALWPETVKQGGFIRLVVVGEGAETVEVENPLGQEVRWGWHRGVRTALLPVSWTAETGDYVFTIRGGNRVQQLPITVADGEFPVQELTIDTSLTQSTLNSDSANAEYMEKAQPVKSEFTGTGLWKGVFMRPVDGGWRSTEFGSIRYVNGSFAERHGGEDLAVAAGTPVYASNSGRVLFAEYLTLTGNTVCISHGLGLKTWYYHMNELWVTPGQDVNKGDVIGLVGSTGFSTGAHLHFGATVGTLWVDPELLLSGTVLPE